MLNKLTVRGKIILSLALFSLIGMIGYLGYEKMTARTITAQSQQQAQTAEGVDAAAKNAHMNLLQSQLDEAAQQIALLKDKQPDTIIKTIPVEVPKIIEVEREKRGADFAVVTTPQEPDKKVDIKEIAKLPEDTPVTLNQYNVFAYKKVIRGINVYPSFTGVTPTGISEVTCDVSHKISKDGKYLGIVGGYDFDARKAKVGLRIMF